MNKKDIREKLLDMRRSLTSKYIEEASEQIFSRLHEMDEVKNAQNVMVYSNFENEVKTANLTGWLLFSGKNVFLPTVQSKEMYAVNIKNAALELSGFGIAQPKLQGAHIIEPEKLDLIIVPGIAFDREKYRLGFGGGYYDRFLPGTRACRIALAYDFQITKALPHEEHDQRMDYIVTPEETVK